MNENLISRHLVAEVRRAIFATRSRELPWEYRVDWVRQGDTPFPAYTIGRSETESHALRNARILLRNTTESADPRAVAAWIKGPDDDEYRQVTP